MVFSAGVSGLWQMVTLPLLLPSPGALNSLGSLGEEQPGSSGKSVLPSLSLSRLSKQSVLSPEVHPRFVL